MAAMTEIINAALLLVFIFGLNNEEKAQCSYEAEPWNETEERER